MFEYYKTILDKVSFDKMLFTKEYSKAMKYLDDDEKNKLKIHLKDKDMIQSLNEIEVYNKMKNILIDMGNVENQIDEETSFEKDLGFDYLDLDDFFIRIEKEFEIRIDIKLLPNVKYSQFDSIGKTINFLSKEYNII